MTGVARSLGGLLFLMLGSADENSTPPPPLLIATFEPDQAAPPTNLVATGPIEPGIPSALDPLGKAVRLEQGGYYKVSDLGTHPAITIQFWIKLLAEPAEGIAGLYASDDWSGGRIHLNLKTGGVLELAINGADVFAISPPGTLEMGKWRHVAATCDALSGELRLYVDGRVVAEGSSGSLPNFILGPGAVGSWFTGQPTRPLSAEMDEFSLLPIALEPIDLRRQFLQWRGVDLNPVDFASQILPILTDNCIDCHGEITDEGGLRLDIRALAHLGGESGEPAIVPYDSDSSEIITLVTHSDPEMLMPSGGPPLEPDQIGLLRAWIDQGAPWPDELAGQAPTQSVHSDHWAFQPIQSPEPPPSDHPFVTTGNAIDAFILDRLARNRLEPSPEADRRTLIRRLYLDVLGLPPTPEQVDRFEIDPSPDAWRNLVEDVLASPHYGERWASHWLDVIRYGETHGFEVNTPRPNAWPYRDYVIKSLNEDKPYDRFLAEQVAGDQLGVDAATGFLVAAPDLLPGQVGRDLASMRQARSDELHEVVVSVSSGLLGLTVGCARCHNHKFDPISQRDYYQMQALFAGVHYGDRPLEDSAQIQLDPNSPPPDVQAVFAGTFSRPEATHRLYRGDPMQRRERVVADVPAVLGSLGLEVNTPDPDRRLALATWLGDPSNPLPARVLVNRIWQHHFGAGLVLTPSDFGAMALPPSHPELLEWLATHLIDSGWSLKAVHRAILLSSTYRQSNRPRAEALAVDAGSRLLWRFPPRRLDMEPVRDSILAVSGSLDLRMGGPGFSVFKPNDNYVRIYDPLDEWNSEQWRRMIYVHRVRMAQDGVFGAFDCPDAGQPAPRRARSTTAIQALNLLNSSFTAQQAQILADRASQEASADESATLDRLFELAYGRHPSSTEREQAMTLAKRHGLDAVARALLNSNEFLFLP